MYIECINHLYVHSVMDFTLRMQPSDTRAVELKVFDGLSER